MNYYPSFERRLASSLPYESRNSIEATVRAMTSSGVMLRVFQDALGSVLDDWPGCTGVVVASFGSFGRLDGHPDVSDFDFAVVYPGPANPAMVASIQERIRILVSHNRCLRFDHRADIEKGGFDFSCTPAYPIVSRDDILSGAESSRAIQILAEGRVVYGLPEGDALRTAILKNWGFRENAALIDLKPLKKHLGEFKDSYCDGVMCRYESGDPMWQRVTNKKVLKLFALREFSYIATLFSIAEIALAVAAGTCKGAYAIELLSSPSALKLLSFCSQRGSIGELMERAGPVAQVNAARILNTIPLMLDHLR